MYSRVLSVQIVDNTPTGLHGFDNYPGLQNLYIHICLWMDGQVEFTCSWLNNSADGSASPTRRGLPIQLLTGLDVHCGG